MKLFYAMTLSLLSFSGIASAGGLSDPIVVPPVGTALEIQDDPSGFYVKLGFGAAEVDPGYGNNDVYLDYHWFKKDMPSDLVSDTTDLLGGNGTATFEVGYLMTNGNFVYGVAGDYTLFNFSESNTCQVDAKAAANPNWIRPEHTCNAALDSALSASLLAGFNYGNWQFLGGLGVTQAQGSQGWEGDIEGRGFDFVSDETATLKGVTYTAEVKYSLSATSQVGLEIQAFDYEEVETQHDWGNTTTDFDVVNYSITYSYSF